MIELMIVIAIISALYSRQVHETARLITDRLGITN